MSVGRWHSALQEKYFAVHTKIREMSANYLSNTKNRLRLQAESKGFRLDDTWLFPATQGSGGKRGTKGSACLKFDAEKEVFDFLGFPWLEPHERNL